MANKRDNPELYWAHRGGTGGNFGIVTSLKLRLHALEKVWPIAINWEIEAAADVLMVWQDQMTIDLKDTCVGLLGFLAMREKTARLCDGKLAKIQEPYFCVRGIYSGDDPKKGAAAIAPLLSVGKPQFPRGALWSKQVKYAEANQHLLDDVEGVIPDAVKETKRCSYIETALSREQYQKMIDYFNSTPSPYNIVSMEPYGGAINNLSPTDTAFVHRRAYFDVFVDSFWLLPAEEAEAFRWLYDYFESLEMKGMWSRNYYQNYPNSEYTNWETGYFGVNYPNLQEVKVRWDPGNVFQFEQSIKLPDQP